MVATIRAWETQRRKNLKKIFVITSGGSFVPRQVDTFLQVHAKIMVAIVRE
jgi:hypothetical protein